MKQEIKPEVVAEVPKEAMVELALNLAPGSGGALVHAGRQYVHGAKYTVPQGVANDLLEMQNRGWAHEASLKENENGLRRRNNVTLSGRR